MMNIRNIPFVRAIDARLRRQDQRSFSDHQPQPPEATRSQSSIEPPLPTPQGIQWRQGACWTASAAAGYAAHTFIPTYNVNPWVNFLNFSVGPQDLAMVGLFAFYSLFYPSLHSIYLPFWISELMGPGD